MLEFGSPQSAAWSFEPDINIYGTPAKERAQADPTKSTTPILPQPSSQPITNQLDGSLGDFTEIWKHLGVKTSDRFRAQNNSDEDQIITALDSDFTQSIKGVKWRDEYDGADLEDNVEPQQISAANLRTRKRAARRARARERQIEQLERDEIEQIPSEPGSDAESAEELESLRRSPDRRALIASLVGRPRPQQVSPPTSPSPPKDAGNFRTPTKKDWPISNPFLWAAPVTPTSSSKTTITAQDGFTPKQRTAHLISKLAAHFPEHRTFLSNSSLHEQAFLPLNVSPIGVHVFVDMSNIAIGFHDCLKIQRGIPITTRTRRVPLNFHNLALVLERGRPAAKRVVCGSDRTSTINQAESCGYEVNILDRVHKVKTPTKAKKHHNSGYKGTAGGYNSASGMSYGETSGSETPGYSSMPTAMYKWSEQAVDEILHLKIALSIVDSETPSTMVLATGDAAEAEYSDGFLKMVERALKAGWAVELVSFKLNTSNLYKRKEWRARYGSNFKWIQLDDFAESLIDEGS